VEGKVRPCCCCYTPHTDPTRMHIENCTVVVEDEQGEQSISKIRERLRGEPQGGTIFVVDVPVAVDIGTNKRGEEAI